MICILVYCIIFELIHLSSHINPNVFSVFLRRFRFAMNLCMNAIRYQIVVLVRLFIHLFVVFFSLCVWFSMSSWVSIRIPRLLANVNVKIAIRDGNRLFSLIVKWSSANVASKAIQKPSVACVFFLFKQIEITANEERKTERTMQILGWFSAFSRGSCYC